MRSNWRSVLATARQITSVRTAARAPAAAAAATTTTTTASAAFALGGVAVVAAAAAAAGTALASAKEKVFEPGHAIGTGLRAELWKRKHAHVNVLEMSDDEEDLVNALMTRLRSKETEGADFRRAANRLLQLALEHALAGLPSDDEVVVTPAGYKFQGSVLEDDVKWCGVIYQYGGGRSLVSAVSDDFGDAPIAMVSVQHDRAAGAAGNVRFADLPESLDNTHVFVLDPVITTGKRTAAVIKELVSRGADPKDVTVVAIVASVGSLDAISNANRGVNFVVAALDVGVDSAGQLMPGLGDFAARYFGSSE